MYEWGMIARLMNVDRRKMDWYTIMRDYEKFASLVTLLLRRVKRKEFEF